MDIDFRPESYLQADLRRQRRWLYAATIGVEVVMLLLVTFMGKGSGDLRRQAEALEAQVAAMRQHQGELDELAAKRDHLMRELAVRRRLESPVTFTQVTATLAENLPASAGLLRLTLTGPTIRVEKPVKKGDKQAADALPPEPLQIELLALAPGDTEVADVVERMANHRLFDQVKLDYSRRAVQGTLIGREFRMEMQVPLDREYRPTHESEEVAHAD